MDFVSLIFLFIAITFVILSSLFFEKHYKYYLCVFEDSTYTTFSGVFFNLSIDSLKRKFKKNVWFCLVYKDSYSLSTDLLKYSKIYKNIDKEIIRKEYKKGDNNE